MTVACRALLVVALALASCGGGGDAARVPAPPEVPREQAQDAPPPGSTVAWAEDWSSESWGGWVRHEPIRCSTESDPQTGEISAQVLGRWGFINEDAARRAISLADGGLRIDYPDHQVGFALLSADRFARTQAWRLSGAVDLRPDDGAWTGLALIHGEGDYREIALRVHGDQMWAYLYAPCYVRALAQVPLGARVLALDYDPADGWRYWIDGVQVHHEPIGFNGASLAGDARVGVYVVNVLAEAALIDMGSVHARLGSLQVHALSPERL